MSGGYAGGVRRWWRQREKRGRRDVTPRVRFRVYALIPC